MSDRPGNLSVAEALERLKKGNRWYCVDRMRRPRGDARRRREVARGQAPFATVVTCSDSRVPPELIFDQGLGDLFVIRVAGNVVDDAILGSIEYASAHLGVNLIVVMGHGSCGAVQAAVANKDASGPATGSHIDALIDAILPAVRKAQAEVTDDLVARSIEENARMVAGTIRCSEPVLATLCSNDVEVRSAFYDLESGEVRWPD